MASREQRRQGKVTRLLGEAEANKQELEMLQTANKVLSATNKALNDTIEQRDAALDAWEGWECVRNKVLAEANEAFENEEEALSQIKDGDQFWLDGIFKKARAAVDAQQILTTVGYSADKL